MKRDRFLGMNGTRSAAIAAICLLSLAGVALGAKHVLDEETGQASALVEEGKRALAENDRGRAVLAFERARWLAPRAGGVRAALAALAVEDPPASLPSRAFRLVTAREWAIAGTASGWIAGLACAIAIARRRRGFFGGLAFGASGGFVVALLGVMMWSATPLAVVTNGDGALSLGETPKPPLAALSLGETPKPPLAALLLAPYAGATPIAELPSGTTVLVGGEHEAFARVELAGGVSGWIPRDRLARVTSSGG